jgi:hypothetical protein
LGSARNVRCGHDGLCLGGRAGDGEAGTDADDDKGASTGFDHGDDACAGADGGKTGHAGRGADADGICGGGDGRQAGDAGRAGGDACSWGHGGGQAGDAGACDDRKGSSGSEGRARS